MTADAMHRAFVIGWPIEHSRSPLIHQFWLKQLGLPGQYEKIAVPPEDLAGFVATMAERGFVGGNVTIPHKETVARLCAELTPAAARLGSVNTLYLADGKLCGDSTDGAGFLSALSIGAPHWRERCRRALVIGAGGAARAVVDALFRSGIAEVLVANRSIPRARSLADDLGARAIALDAVTDVLPTIDLLVNSTAAGMAGQPPLDLSIEALPAHAIVDDLVYVPAETPLLQRARARGLTTVGGLDMLLFQAAPGFARWFGQTPEVSPALRALVSAEIASTA